MRKCFLFLILLTTTVRAQPEKVVGNWLGTLEAGPQKLRLAFHITQNDKGELTSTLDSLDQNALGIPVQQTTFTNGKLHLDIPAAQGARYDGTLSSDGTEIDGTFTTQIGPLPLVLKRGMER